jgi:hypothetical protein
VNSRLYDRHHNKPDDYRKSPVAAGIEDLKKTTQRPDGASHTLAEEAVMMADGNGMDQTVVNPNNLAEG